MSDSRTKKSVKNISYAMAGYIASLALQLIGRLVFVRFLSTEYLGINGLFSNILSMLALSELGVGGAIIFALYKPVAQKDTEKIKSLMDLYKKMYTAIGWFIIIAGISITPFLQIFIKEMPEIKNLRIYYMLYVLNSGVSYFYSYKRSLIICDQNEYISTATTTAASIAARLVQIIMLYMTHSYLLFLIVQIVFTRAENIIIAGIADKKYPYLKEKDIKPLPKTDTDSIKKNVLAMILHKLGSVIVNATDNIIVSKILGLASVGFLSNYTMIFDTAFGIVVKIFTAITASLGNMAAIEDKDTSEKVFYRILFGNFWLVSVFSICLMCLVQPLIKLWLGADYLLNNMVLITLVGCFYLMSMRKTVLQFRDAAGLFWYDKYKVIFESALNLLFSIPLTIHFGIAGVKLGTIISTLLTSFWIEGFILFKYFFVKNSVRYLLEQLMYVVLTTSVCLLTMWCCSIINMEGVLGLFIKGLVCMAIPNSIYLLLFNRKDEFKYYRGMLFNVLTKKKE